MEREAAVQWMNQAYTNQRKTVLQNTKEQVVTACHK